MRDLFDFDVGCPSLGTDPTNHVESERERLWFDREHEFLLRLPTPAEIKHSIEKLGEDASEHGRSNARRRSRSSATMSPTTKKERRRAKSAVNSLLSEQRRKVRELEEEADLKKLLREHNHNARQRARGKQTKKLIAQSTVSTRAKGRVAITRVAAAEAAAASISSVSGRGSKPRGKVRTAKASAKTLAKTQAEEEEELKRMLANHNKRFKKPPAFEPRKHSVRDVKAWEKRNGKKWGDLTHRERAQANEEIAEAKRKS